jgi:hypothetical protein
MAWMTVEAAVTIAAGVMTSSIALAGFGLDSVIEFFAAAVVVWQRRERGLREARSPRLIGVPFFALAAYLAAESIRVLISQASSGQLPAGIAVTSAALLVMPSLTVAKHRTGKALSNRTLLCRRRRKRLLRLHLRSRAPGSRTQRLARLLAGRPRSISGHRRARRKGRPRSPGRELTATALAVPHAKAAGGQQRSLPSTS